jgi:predicted DCC family thiol-disulfide oxidoreductase YuxK
MKPVFFFDGDCAFCRAWVARWKKTTGEAVEFRPFPLGEKRPSSEFVDADGKVCRGAQGVFRLLATGSRGRLLWCYQHLPLFASVSELVYRAASSCRACAYRLTKRLFRLD